MSLFGKSKLNEEPRTFEPAKVEEKPKSGDIEAAIATALYLYSSDVHDLENTVLTINRTAKMYSPWSSKIYGLTQNPRLYR